MVRMPIGYAIYTLLGLVLIRKNKIMKKQFLLFAGDDYYPEGGAYDFKGSFETAELAVKAHDPNEHKYDGGWANIFDLKEEKIVKQFSRGTWYEGDDEIY